MWDTSLILHCILVLGAIYVVRWRTHPLRHIPSVGGFSSPGLSYLTALYATFHAKKMVDAGIAKYYGSAFKVPLLDRWMVVVSGPDMVTELKKRPEDELSVTDGVLELVQLQYMIGRTAAKDPAHLIVVQKRLTSWMLAPHIPKMADELQFALRGHLPAPGTSDWVSVQVLPMMNLVVTRLCTRAFIGLPVCRNEDYIRLTNTFTVDIVKAAVVLSVLPLSLKPFVAPLVNSMRQTVKRALPHLGTIINERRDHAGAMHSSWDDKPNDILQWLIEDAVRKNYTDADVIESLFLVNLGAIHNSSNTLTHTLYHLAESPEYLIPLREEIEPIIAAEGWTASALSKMEKLDSFLTECQRYTGVGITSMIRKAVKDITLNDGTRVPRGTLVQVASHSVHRNEAYYENPETFDPFRFSRMRERQGVKSSKYQAATTMAEYISFGHGQHACPGRFFAVSQIKMVLAHIIMNYDLKFEGGGGRPPNLYLAFNVLPALGGRVMFRAKQF